MTASAGYKSRLLLGDFNLSVSTRSVASPYTVDMLDVSAFSTDGSKSFIIGQNTSTLSIDGLADTDATVGQQFDQVSTWTDAQPVTYAPRGLTLGSELRMHNAWRTSLELSANVTSPVGFKLNGQTDGITDWGVSLHDLTAETTTANGTGYDQTVVSTTAGGVGHLHVTAFSGFTNIIVTVQDSADNSTFATIGTFATVTAATQERLVIAGTVRRYVRASWTKTGTGSATFVVGFARR